MHVDPILVSGRPPRATFLLSSLLVLISATAIGCGNCGGPVNPDAGNPEPGEPCRFNSDCEGGYCGDEGTCIAGLPPGTCLTDDDCDGEEICLIPTGGDIGSCVNPHACDEDDDCTNPDQICADGDGDGYRDCIFDGCEDDDECVAEIGGTCTLNEAARCVARACVCRDLCGAPCGDGRECCATETPTCIDDPGACADLPCEPGFAGATDAPGEWVAPACGYPDATCECRELPPLAAGIAGAPNRLIESPAGDRYVVAYNQTYGDVVVGPANISPVSGWIHADGVPTVAAIEGGVSGPRGGVAELGDDVGRSLDATFDAAGTLHIVARNETTGNLRLISGPPEGPFVGRDLVTNADAGFAPRIIVDSTGRIAIAHVERRSPAGTSSRLRVLAAANVTAASGDFVAYTVRSTTLSTVDCEGGCVEGEVCPAVAEGQTAQCVSEAASCSPVCEGSDVCVAAGCQVAADAAPENVALAVDGTAMVESATGVVIFGHDPRNGTLMSFRSNGNLYAGSANFTTETEAQDPTLDFGSRPSAVRVSSGYLVASTETADRGVFLRQFNTGLVEQGAAVAIDDGERVHPSGAKDEHAVDLGSVHTDTAGTGVVAWQDGTDGSVRARLRASDGSLGPMQILAGGPLSPTYAGNYGFSVTTLGGANPAVAAERLWLGGEPAVTEVVVLDNFLLCPGQDDAFEPNDVEANALAMPNTNVVGGIACGNDDWFSFQANAGCDLAISLTFNDEDGDLDLRVNAPDASVVGTSVGTSDDEIVSATAAATGTYKVRVQAFNGAENAYVLRADVTCD